MFNRSEIIKTAWRRCRADNTYNGVFYFSRDKFAAALKAAWQAARLAAGVLTPAEVRKIERAVAIREQIEMLNLTRAARTA